MSIQILIDMNLSPNWVETEEKVNEINRRLKEDGSMCPRLPDNMDRGPSTSLPRVASQLKFYADLRFRLQVLVAQRQNK